MFAAADSDYLKYSKLVPTIKIGETYIDFVPTAEHVGILRSVSCNLAHLQQRVSSHQKALSGILSSGMARRHRANPLASLRAEKIYGIPVLFSGVATLILSKAEINVLDHQVKKTIQNFLKLHQKTPDPVVFFLAGMLPGSAILHLKQLTIFGMVCRLPDNILHKIAKEQLIVSGDRDSSWFSQVKHLCFTYNLPHPLILLDNPPPKQQFKELVKTSIIDYWQTELRSKANPIELPSLQYFKPQYMSLSRPHPLWSTCKTSYDVNKSIIQSRMLSGRYRVGSLLRHFSPSCSGICELCSAETEDLAHLLLPRCVHLQERRTVLVEYWRSSEKTSSQMSSWQHKMTKPFYQPSSN